ncbi:MAG: hypothetical protein MOGDAGHF_00727 [Rhodocyclaceae bacterium]|nr:hypothetical protein [Rhodocyclaceae bacterium]
MSARSKARSKPPRFIFAIDSALPPGIDPPEKPPRSARFVARLDMFSQSACNERSDTYRLSKNRRRSHWILWLGYFDDNMEMKWVYVPYAIVPCCGVGAKEAATQMLEAAWLEEKQRGWLETPFEAVIDDGLLKVDELREIAARVWPKEGGASCS